MSEPDLDLLIIGAGPAGIAASMYASTLGLSHLVMERRAGLHEHPQAHVIKTRSTEILRRFGLDGRIHSSGASAEEQRFTIWCTTLAGPEFGRIDLLDKKGPCERFLSVSPTYPANIPQNVLEPILYQYAAELKPGAFRFGVECLSVRNEAHSAVAELRTENGIDQQRARYVIAADGAGSRIRRNLGIGFEGSSALAHFCTIHIKSDFTPLIADRPGVLYWILNPDVAGVFIVHNMRTTQVFMLPYDPEKIAAAHFTPEFCKSRIEAAIGTAHPFEIVFVDQWAMASQVANHYRAGRTILVGDAAHRFPPTGGLGLNTGLQDINNLMWKLHAVLRRGAPDSLLDTYEEECQPIACRNRDRSADNHERMAKVQAAVGVSPDRTEFARSLDELFGAAGKGRREEVQSAIDEQLPHFAHLDVEMAPEYRSGAFGGSIGCRLPGLPAVEGYSPNLNPGAALPHFVLSDGRSSLDAIEFDKAALFLSEEAASRWREAVDAADDLPIAVNIHAVGARARSVWEAMSGGLNVAVLVRPDGHIGWLCDARVEDCCSELRRAAGVIFRSSPEIGSDQDKR